MLASSLALMLSLLCCVSAGAMEVPTDSTVQNLNGVQQYIKTYTVSPELDPASLIEEPFRYEGYTYAYHITETGHIVVRANRKAMQRDRRKLRAFRRKIDAGEMTPDDLWTSVNGMLAYLKQFDEHKNILRLRRMFFALFGFSCETYKSFKEGAKQHGLYHDQAL